MSKKENQHIAIIDICRLVDSVADKDGNEYLKKTAKTLVDTLSTVGFAYIVGHGIKQEQVDLVNDTAKTFFDLPTGIKEHYKRSETTFNGWASFQQEQLNPQRPGDLKESFNSGVTKMEDQPWPDKEVPGFSGVVKQFYSSCNALSFIILRLIGIGLELEDPDYFLKQYNPFTKPNPSTLRMLYYPPVNTSTEILPNQIRCGEHTDYGVITLLFQDSVGGLEVCGPDGQYISATPIEGSVLLNVGDMIQRWTSDRLLATPHRVMIPDDKSTTGRQSLAYFVDADDDAVVECIDGSNKYEKINALDFLQMRLYGKY